ncbi:uncharacterized protein TRIVIDRAFT_190511 [Trichoderma virens Gv29-8]|uniref:Uncharacterized protein n=1 Tax=Hypocrea virens (strain Gv29-8 / FGSC 10586) TaxID=413071 RepID=G9MNV1_HYPVG|nr:uncharacterized protein TRIVIDRAFT_190511 [Trichoderma virens Gv29-8]EHK23554.1 hypothetical protein TRIVIDRAFT_190511 [Trichoderma virens Gv29-8]
MSSARAIESNNIGNDARIHQGDVIHNYANAPREPCVLIPFFRNEGLILRQDIISELDRILPLSDDYSTAALYGLGGSGKTQIALDFAYRRCQVPSCSVYWVHADNETTFTQDFKSIAKRLGVSGNLVGEDLLMAVRYRIEMNPPWALILDNADDLRLFGVSNTTQDALNLEERVLSLDKFIPRGPRGQVLWTSRDERIDGGLVAAGRAIKVSKMTPTEARALFNSLRNNRVDGNEAKDIAELLAELDWLPLAISQAAAYMKRTLITVEEYMSKLKDGKKRWRILKQSQTDRHRRREVSNSILETWNISMQLLRIENKRAHQVLHIHAFLDNQNIPVELIRQAALYTVNRNKVDRAHEEQDDDSSSDCDSDGDKTNEAIARLRDFSFLSTQAAGDGNRSYKMHKLVQEAMRYGLGRKERKEEEKYFSAAALEITSSLFPSSRPETWNECEKYITHAQQACEWATLCGRELEASNLLFRLGRYLHQRGRWRECEIPAEEMEVNALRLREEIQGKTHHATISSKAELAITNFAMSKSEEAGKTMEEVLAIQREAFGNKDPKTMLSMTRLALIYFAQSRYKEAEGIIVEALTLQHEILGHKHPDTILSNEYLGHIYSALNRHKEAEELLVKALALRQEVLGDNHPYTILAMSNLGDKYHQTGKYKEAEGMKAKALALRREIFGTSLNRTRRAIEMEGHTERVT